MKRLLYYFLMVVAIILCLAQLFAYEDAHASVTVIREYEPTTEELTESPDTESKPDEECLELNAPAICSEAQEPVTTQDIDPEDTSDPQQSYPQYSEPSAIKVKTVTDGKRKMKQKRKQKRKVKDGRLKRQHSRGSSTRVRTK